MTWPLAIILALLMFALFAWWLVDQESVDRGKRIVSLIADNKRLRGRIQGLEATVTALSEQSRNQLGEPVYDQLAVARLRREIEAYQFGGSA